MLISPDYFLTARKGWATWQVGAGRPPLGRGEPGDGEAFGRVLPVPTSRAAPDPEWGAAWGATEGWLMAAAAACHCSLPPLPSILALVPCSC